MKREELLATARKHMWAAWQLSSEELASLAADTLIGLGMLVPEGGAQELERLRVEVAELKEQRERRRIRLVALQNDALNMRGSLSPMGEERKVPFPLGETLTPAVDWLIARVAELEAESERLKANLAGWWKRGRAAEDDLRSARIRIAELETRAAAGPDAVWWLAQYEGVNPELFATEAAAREFCDDQAAGEVDQWDWFPDGDGVWQQVETSDLDDRPLSVAPGSVRRLALGRADGITQLIAPTQVLREDSYESPLRHEYRLGRDLPETDGAQ